VDRGVGLCACPGCLVDRLPVTVHPQRMHSKREDTATDTKYKAQYQQENERGEHALSSQGFPAFGDGGDCSGQEQRREENCDEDGYTHPRSITVKINRIAAVGILEAPPESNRFYYQDRYLEDHYPHTSPSKPAFEPALDCRIVNIGLLDTLAGKIVPTIAALCRRRINQPTIWAVHWPPLLPSPVGVRRAGLALSETLLDSLVGHGTRSLLTFSSENGFPRRVP
jgi:hypothetical protein